MCVRAGNYFLESEWNISLVSSSACTSDIYSSGKIYVQYRFMQSLSKFLELCLFRVMIFLFLLLPSGAEPRVPSVCSLSAEIAEIRISEVEDGEVAKFAQIAEDVESPKPEVEARSP